MSKKESKHKLVSEHEKHFLIHDGSGAFVVAKHGLDESHMKKIRKLQKFAEGGDVKPLEVEEVPAAEQTPEPKDVELPEGPQGSSEENPIEVTLPEKAASTPEANPLELPTAAAATPAPQDNRSMAERAGAHIRDSVKGGIADTASAVAKVASPVVQFSKGLLGTAEQPSETPSVSQPKTGGIPKEQQVGAPKAQEQKAELTPYDVAYNNYLKGFDLESAGYDRAAKAKAEFGQTMANAYEKQRQDLETEKANTEANYNQLKKENEQLFNEVKDSKIDPNHYWDQKGTGGKITAAIALVLGGIAGGLDRTGRNAALEVIQKNIDRDIDAQKANLSKKDSLLKRNFEKIGDLRAAEAVTRSQLMAITAAQVEKSKSMASSELAKSEAAQLQGQLMERMAQSGLQFSALNAKSQLASGNGRGVNPEYLDKETRERLVQLPSGRQAIAYTPKDAEEVRKKLGSIQPIISSLDRLDEIGSKALIDPTSYQEADSIRKLLIPQILKSEGFNRLTEEDQKLFSDTFRNPTSFRSLLGDKSRSDNLRKMIEMGLQEELKNRLEGYKPPFKPATAKPYQGK